MIYNVNYKPLPWLGNHLVVMPFTDHVYEHDMLACDKTPYLAIYNYLCGFIQF